MFKHLQGRCNSFTGKAHFVYVVTLFIQYIIVRLMCTSTKLAPRVYLSLCALLQYIRDKQ